MSTIKFRAKYGDSLTFSLVEPSDAADAMTAHQKGNGGTVLLRRAKGGDVSIRVGEFVAVETDPPEPRELRFLSPLLLVGIALCIIVYAKWFSS